MKRLNTLALGLLLTTVTACAPSESPKSAADRTAASLERIASLAEQYGGAAPRTARLVSTLRTAAGWARNGFPKNGTVAVCESASVLNDFATELAAANMPVLPEITFALDNLGSICTLRTP